MNLGEIFTFGKLKVLLLNFNVFDHSFYFVVAFVLRRTTWDLTVSAINYTTVFTGIWGIYG